MSIPATNRQLVTPAAYMEMRYNTQMAMAEVARRLELFEKEFETIFGRIHGAVEAVDCEDADVIMVTTGTVTATCRQVLADLRSKGEKVGLFKLKLFRPFPADLIYRHLKSAPKIAVIDRNISFGAGGIFAQEIRAALCNLQPRPQVFGYIAGLGGRDITPDTLVEISRRTKDRPAPEADTTWIGLNRETVESWCN